MTGPRCRCGHDRGEHARPYLQAAGRCESFWDDATGRWVLCKCEAFDDSVLPEPGEKLTFGVHRQPSPDAETAEAWPSMPSWSARVKARTTRALRTLR